MSPWFGLVSLVKCDRQPQFHFGDGEALSAPVCLRGHRLDKLNQHQIVQAIKSETKINPSAKISIFWLPHLQELIMHILP